MSIRIGNTVYIRGLTPIALDPAEDLPIPFPPAVITERALQDMLAMRPGGIVRVGLTSSSHAP